MENHHKSNDKILKFNDYYVADPETAALMKTPEWKELMQELDARDNAIKEAKKIPNIEAVRNLSLVMKNVKAILDNSELPLELKIDHSKHGDRVIVNVFGIGMELKGKQKERLLNAISVADEIQVSVHFSPDKFNLMFIVEGLHTFVKP